MTIHVVGDSHAIFGWMDLYIQNVNIVIHKLGPILMYTFEKRGIELIDINSLGINQGDFIIFCLGEIDCRCHINKFEDYIKTIDDLVENYTKTISKIKELIPDVKLGIYNIIPPMKREFVSESVDFPIRGTDEERLKYCSYINEKLKEKCLELDYIFIDIREKYQDKDGFLDYSLSDKNIHIFEPSGLKEIIEKIIQN
jgi:hypothetical protein